MTEQQKRQVEKAKRTGPGSQRTPSNRKRPWVHRKAEKVEWDYEYLHKHYDAMKNAEWWGAQGQGNWSKEWERYGKQMLSLAKSQFRSNKKPLPPKCDSSNQVLKQYARPGHLQGVSR